MMARRITRATGWINAAIRVLLAILLLLALGVSFTNVVLRVVFLEALFWAEEVLAFWLVWSVFLGAYLVTLDGRHLTMDLVHRALPPPIRRAIDLAAAVVIAGASLFVLYQSAQILEMMARFGQRSMAAGIPVVIPHSSIAVGFGLMALAVLIRALGGAPEGAGPGADRDCRRPTD